MIDKIKEYTSDKYEIEISEELLNNFQSNKIINKIKSYEIISWSATNFGNLGNVIFEFGKTLLVSGDREQGKSWFGEIPLWALTGKCRTITQVEGNNGNATEVVLNFKFDKKKYTIRRNRIKGSAYVELLETGNAGSVITGDEVEEKLCKIFNFNFADKEDLFNIFYYTPKISFTFSRKEPRDIESLLIKLNNNDIWLELEEFTKTIRKDEDKKLIELNGIVSYIGEGNDNIDDIKEKITFLKNENKAYTEDINSLVLPDINLIKKEMNEVNTKLLMINELYQRIENVKKNRLEKEQLIKDNKDYTKQIAEYTTQCNVMKTAEGRLQELLKQQSEIVAHGNSLAKDIKDKQALLNDTSICPILKKECNDIKEISEKLKSEIQDLTQKKATLAKEYQNVTTQYNNLKAQITQSYELQKKLAHLENSVSDNNKKIEALDKLGADDVNITDIKSEIKGIGDKEKTQKEYDKLTGEYQNFTKIIADLSGKKLEISKSIMQNDLKIKDYERIIKNFSDYKKYMKEKTELSKRQVALDKLIPLFGKKQIPKTESVKSLKKLNEYMNYFLSNLSGDTITATINDNFKMDIELKDKPKILSPKLVSDGQEFLINLSFVLSCALYVSGGNTVSFFVCDDCFAYQNDSDSESIVRAFLKFQKDKKINQLMLISNRLTILKKFKNEVDNLIIFKNGSIA